MSRVTDAEDRGDGGHRETAGGGTHGTGARQLGGQTDPREAEGEPNPDGDPPPPVEHRKVGDGDPLVRGEDPIADDQDGRSDPGTEPVSGGEEGKREQGLVLETEGLGNRRPW